MLEFLSQKTFTDTNTQSRIPSWSVTSLLGHSPPLGALGLSFSPLHMPSCSPHSPRSLPLSDSRTQAGVLSPPLVSEGPGETPPCAPLQTREERARGWRLLLPPPGPTPSSCFADPTPHYNAHRVAASQEKPQKGNIIKKVYMLKGSRSLP